VTGLSDYLGLDLLRTKNIGPWAKDELLDYWTTELSGFALELAKNYEP